MSQAKRPWTSSTDLKGLLNVHLRLVLGLSVFFCGGGGVGGGVSIHQRWAFPPFRKHAGLGEDVADHQKQGCQEREGSPAPRDAGTPVRRLARHRRVPGAAFGGAEDSVLGGSRVCSG